MVRRRPLWLKLIVKTRSLILLIGYASRYSALEAVASYLDLIVPEDDRVREQLLRIHLQIAQADQVLRDGMRELRVYLPAAGGSVLAPNPLAAPPEVEELSRPLTRAAMASVTY